VISWFQSLRFFKCNVYRYSLAENDWYRVERAMEIVMSTGRPVGREGWRTFHHVIVMRQNTVQSITASMIHPCNQSDTPE
jgi:tRNA A37 N6-isopentenylltransferase MiaA